MRSAVRLQLKCTARIEAALVQTYAHGFSLRQVGSRFRMSWRAARAVIERRAPYLLPTPEEGRDGPDRKAAPTLDPIPRRMVHRARGSCPGEPASGSPPIPAELAGDSQT
jgi:hypothetical protein